MENLYLSLNTSEAAANCGRCGQVSSCDSVLVPIHGGNHGGRGQWRRCWREVSRAWGNCTGWTDPQGNAGISSILPCLDDFSGVDSVHEIGRSTLLVLGTVILLYLRRKRLEPVKEPVNPAVPINNDRPAIMDSSEPLAPIVLGGNFFPNA